MPVLPGITDRPDQLEPLIKAVAQAGATYLNACALRLRSAARQRYLPFIEKEFPDLASRYRGTYGSSHHAGDRYREGLHAYFTKICKRHGVPFGRETDDDDAEAAQHDASDDQLMLQLA
jgi:DNA repair photolyase